MDDMVESLNRINTICTTLLVNETDSGILKNRVAPILDSLIKNIQIKQPLDFLRTHEIPYTKTQDGQLSADFIKDEPTMKLLEEFKKELQEQGLLFEESEKGTVYVRIRLNSYSGNRKRG
jgi:hypothetical protein